MSEAEPAAPEPVQVMEYVLLPAVEMVTASDPLVDLVPLQAPEALQAVALVEDHVKVEELLSNTDAESAVRETVAASGVDPPLPPPPPPPQLTTKIIIATRVEILIRNI